MKDLLSLFILPSSISVLVVIDFELLLMVTIHKVVRAVSALKEDLIRFQSWNDELVNAGRVRLNVIYAQSAIPNVLPNFEDIASGFFGLQEHSHEFKHGYVECAL